MSPSDASPLRHPASNFALDAGIAIGLMAAFATLFLATFQGRVYGNDGAILCEWAVLPEHAYNGYHNVLFVRLAQWCSAAFPTEDPLAPTEFLVACSAAIGLGISYLCCRLVGCQRRGSVLATAALGLSPAMWFFATVVEVHATHFMLGASGLLVVLAAPWSRPALATLLSSVPIALTYLSHQSAPALGFAWVAAAQYGRLRRGLPPFRMLALGGIGMGFLVALLIGRCTSNAIRGEGFALGLNALAGTVEAWQENRPWQVFIDEVSLPLSLMLLLGVVGWLAGAAQPNRIRALWRSLLGLALFLPTASFAVYWGVIERGGYMLVPAIGLTIAAAALWARAGGAVHWILLVLLILHAGFGGWIVKQHDGTGFQFRERAEIVDRLLPDGGYVVSAKALAPPITVHLPEVTELDLLPSFAGLPSIEAWQTEARLAAITHLIDGRPFVLDRSYQHIDDHWDGLLHGCFEALELAIRSRFEVDEHPHPHWEMWLVRPR